MEPTRFRSYSFMKAIYENLLEILELEDHRPTMHLATAERIWHGYATFLHLGSLRGDSMPLVEERLRYVLRWPRTELHYLEKKNSPPRYWLGRWCSHNYSFPTPETVDTGTQTDSEHASSKNKENCNDGVESPCPML